ncbi:methyltransferase, partial [candidate division KSB1 bacterium]|nr:methyltransferase [candidate division KSB1 bacterium]
MSMKTNGTDKSTPKINVEKAVRERYESGAQAAEAALCCPVEYDTKY